MRAGLGPSGPPALNTDDRRAAVVRDRLATVRRRLAAAGGDPAAVRVVAVTKGLGLEAVADALAAGVTDVAENYASELVAKATGTASRSGTAPGGTAPGGAAAPRWHFLGAIQRNKVRRLAPLVDCWQSVARVVEGEEIARHRPGARVLVQVDTTGEPGRNGCAPDEVGDLVGVLRQLPLDVAGLMTVAPRPPEPPSPAFAVVRRLADELGLAERSMGMSDDLEEAVAQGSTMVRVGRALFGPRPAPHESPRRRTTL